MPSDHDLASLSRRRAIGAGVLGALSASSLARSGPMQAAHTPSPAPPRQRAVRIAHLTDMHVQPERGAEAGLAKCLAHVQSLDVKPDLVLTGGDHVMDAFEQAAPRANLLRTLWRDTLKRECSLRVESAIGNHDIWGWHSKSKLSGAEPEFGKAFALDLLGLANRFRSFDVGGWHVVVLDSIQRRPDTYVCEIDAEQFAWLEQDLGAKPASQPVLVLSHAPIITVTVPAKSETRKEDNLQLPGNLVHLDGQKLHALFRSKNVKLCLSGHIHLLDRCLIDGVTYLCDGAVCGGWWKGPNKGVAEGYGIVDLFDDGGFEHRYATYGWVAKDAAKAAT